MTLYRSLLSGLAVASGVGAIALAATGHIAPAVVAFGAFAAFGWMLAEVTRG